MIKGGRKGGSTITGLSFEKSRDINTLLRKTPVYEIKNNNQIFYKGKEVARSYKKHGLYIFLEKEGVDYKKHISKRLLPDEALFVITNNTVFIIEVKTQKVAGSVDEKLQTCDFKLKQYKKLFSTLNIEAEYIYILDEWFKRPEYKDTLDYIISVGCQYYFHYLPLHKLGLPVPK